jgi:hypothetical protein
MYKDNYLVGLNVFWRYGLYESSGGNICLVEEEPA